MIFPEPLLKMKSANNYSADMQEIDFIDLSSPSKSDLFSNIWIEVSDIKSTAKFKNLDVEQERFDFGFDEDGLELLPTSVIRENSIGLNEFVELDRNKKNADQVIFGIGMNGKEINLDLNLSHINTPVNAFLNYDIDSMILKFRPNDLKKEITLSLTCSTQSLISKDFGFISNEEKLIHIPHMTIGHLDSWTIYIYFPKLAHAERRYKNGVSVLNSDKIEFLETIFYPCLYEISSNLMKQKLPLSYKQARTISNGNSSFNIRLSRNEFIHLISRIREHSNQTSKFHKFEFYASMKGKKFEFENSEDYFRLIENVVENWFFIDQITNFCVDIAKTFTPSIEAHSFCFKKNVLKTLFASFSGNNKVNLFKYRAKG